MADIHLLQRVYLFAGGLPAPDVQVSKDPVANRRRATGRRIDTPLRIF
jgi:hypothetical protein